MHQSVMCACSKSKIDLKVSLTLSGYLAIPTFLKCNDHNIPATKTKMTFNGKSIAALLMRRGPVTLQQSTLFIIHNMEHR